MTATQGDEVGFRVIGLAAQNLGGKNPVTRIKPLTEILHNRGMNPHKGFMGCLATGEGMKIQAFHIPDNRGYLVGGGLANPVFGRVVHCSNPSVRARDANDQSI